MEKEKDNFYRFICLITEVGGEVQRCRLKQSYSNLNLQTLSQFLNDRDVLHTLFHLFFPSHLCCWKGCSKTQRAKGFSKNQWNILYDTDPIHCCKQNQKDFDKICICCVTSKNVNESDLDLSLLSLILNNCCNLTQKEQIAVKYLRDMKNNYISHRPMLSLSNSDFQSLWHQAEINIKHLDSTNIYACQLNNLLHRPMDVSLMQKYFVYCLEASEQLDFERKDLHASIDRGNENVIEVINDNFNHVNKALQQIQFTIEYKQRESNNAGDGITTKRKRQELADCLDVSNEEENNNADNYMSRKRKQQKLELFNLYTGNIDDLRYKLPDTKPLDKSKEYISSNLLGSKVSTAVSLQMDYKVCTMKDLSKQPVARITVPTKDKDLSSKIEKDWQQGNINPKHSSLEVNYITTGCVVIWVKVDLLLFLNIGKFYSAVDNLVNDIFQKSAVNLPLYSVEVYDIATGYVDNLTDEFSCGDCKLKCNTLDNFISHKKTRCFHHVFPENGISLPVDIKFNQTECFFDNVQPNSSVTLESRYVYDNGFVNKIQQEQSFIITATEAKYVEPEQKQGTRIPFSETSQRTDGCPIQKENVLQHGKSKQKETDTEPSEDRDENIPKKLKETILGVKKRLSIVAAIHSGSAFSSFAFSFKERFIRNRIKKRLMRQGQNVAIGDSFNYDIIIEALGNQAEYWNSEIVRNDLDETQIWYYDNWFKTKLFSTMNLKTLMTIKKSTGRKELKAADVFAFCIECIKKPIFGKAKEQFTDVKGKEPHYLVRIPAIWNEAAQQFVSESAEKTGTHQEKLTLALEPEVAAFCCKYLDIQKEATCESANLRPFDTGARFLVGDFGGRPQTCSPKSLMIQRVDQKMAYVCHERMRVLDVFKDLDSHDFAPFKYLCQDDVHLNNLHTCHETTDIFQLLLHEESLIEYAGHRLYLMDKPFLVNELGLELDAIKTVVGDDPTSTITAYRKALFNVAQDLSMRAMIQKSKDCLKNTPPSVCHIEKKGRNFHLNGFYPFDQCYSDELSKTFSQLNYKIENHEDLKSHQILQVAETLSKQDHNRNCSVVVCVLSHGGLRSVYGVDGFPVPLRSLTEKFTGSNCKSLFGKPKLFFVQACRGKNEPIGHLDTFFTRSGASARNDVMAMDKDEDNTVEDVIPDENDFLLAVSTAPWCSLYRRHNNRSYFIQTLCERIQKDCMRHHLLDILTDVNMRVGKYVIQIEDDQTVKTIPSYYSTLTHKLHFYSVNTG
ncbi:unnamed protein product [Mytilus coruscus]|uniref:Caspase-8 n=1 Tax=Mytilus coruscus TaxID=42192 RepID=A0A6J8C5J9_MYTCO|nr:unnamed protein product [Mytilus coruscus]